MEEVTKFHVLECADCNIPFAITAGYDKTRRDDHRVFYCPSGHRNFYPHKSEAEKLKARLETAQRDATFWQKQEAARQEEARKLERSLNAVRGHLTRAKNQLIKGNCPNCDEHFDNLEAHISEKHPGFDLELTAEPETPEQANIPRKRGRPRKSFITKPQPETREERKAAVTEALETE